MACLIKLPLADSKGVISFTTQEEPIIRNSPGLMHLLNKVKEKYVIGLHYNWHNYDCKPDTLFDFHLAGEEDLIVTNGQPINQIYLDACNFTKASFSEKDQAKFWDILFVARAVYFKGIPEFFQTIRELYDNKHFVRVLFICPMPPYDKNDEQTVFYNLRELYNELFSPEEQELFNLLTLKDRYPFFFDRDTLAHFFKSSKIFVHTAPDERRCRVAAYAWCANMPVVGRDCVGSLLSKNLRREPFFYEIGDNINTQEQILKALANYQFDSIPVEKELSEIYTIDTLAQKLVSVFQKQGLEFKGTILKSNLDIRMGRHHGKGSDPNSVNLSMEDFLTMAMHLDEEKNSDMINNLDPEKMNIKTSEFKPRFNQKYLPYQRKYMIKASIKKILKKLGLRK